MGGGQGVVRGLSYGGGHRVVGVKMGKGVVSVKGWDLHLDLHR